MKQRLVSLILPALSAFIHLLQTIRQRLGRASFNAATEEDIYYAYRLFLNRQPDPEGYAVYQTMVRHHHVSIQFLTDSFLYSRELQEIQAERNKLLLVDLPDFKLYVRLNDYFIGAAIASQKSYEPHVSSALLEILQPDHTFLDIGGNIGYFSMLAASKMAAGQVIAFEPVPDNCDSFRQSVAANGYTHVTLHPYAVADVSQTVALNIGARNSNSQMMAAELAEADLLRVEAVVLDDFLAEMPALHVVKMDIEGAEPLAVRGMMRLLRRFKPTLFIEFSPQLIQTVAGDDPQTFLQTLVDSGYRLAHLPTSWNQSIYALPTQSPAEMMALCRHLTFQDHIDLVAFPEL